MTTKFGLIAEDSSDITVLKNLMDKLINTESYSTKSFVGNGCGKIVSKATAWANDLRKRGCHRLILVHDLDDKDELALRETLNNKLIESNFDIYCVIVPKEEIEAWLLCDSPNLTGVLKTNRIFYEIHHPETVPSPKEFIKKTSKELGGRRYINTLHNPIIAKNIDVETLIKCPSFADFSDFVKLGVPKNQRI